MLRGYNRLWRGCRPYEGREAAEEDRMMMDEFSTAEEPAQNASEAGAAEESIQKAEADGRLAPGQF